MILDRVCFTLKPVLVQGLGQILQGQQEGSSLLFTPGRKQVSATLYHHLLVRRRHNTFFVPVCPNAVLL